LLFSLALEVPAADQLKDLGKTNPQSSRGDTHPSALIVHHSSRILQFKVLQRSSGDPPGANAIRAAACNSLQSPVLQRTPAKIASPGPSTLGGVEVARFCAFAPPGSPLDRYTLPISTMESGFILGF
jgi:hypothetical protein